MPVHARRQFLLAMQRNLHDTKRWLSWKRAGEKWHGDVVNGDIVDGVPLERPMVSVSVEHGGHGEAQNRLFQSAGPEKWKDLERLTFHGPPNRRVVQDHDATRRSQPGERGFEPERFVDAHVDELLDHRLAP